MASIISAGTTSGTSLNLSGDTSGVLQLASNGSTTAVTIDTSQNVGIGTASPSAPLDIQSNSGGTGIRVRGRASANAGAIRYFANDNTTQRARIESNDTSLEINSISSLPITILTADTERMRITSTGQVTLTRPTGDDTQIDFLRMQGGGVTAADNLAFLSKYTASVTTSAKPIFGGPPRGSLVIVTGYTAASFFSDILNCSSNSVSVISSQNSTGSPASRTYSIVSFLLNLTMGSGTYNVGTLLLGTLPRE